MGFRLLGLLLAAATPLAAQYRPIAPAPSRLFAAGAGSAAPALSADTLPKVGDHRWTGAAIGGVLGGVLGYVMANASGGDYSTLADASGTADNETSNLIFGTAAGAFVGGGLGYLMGRSTPKGAHPANSQPVAPIVDTGIPAGRGAAIGAGIGAVALSAYAIWNPSAEDGAMVIVAAPFGALVGAFVGYGVTRE